MCQLFWMVEIPIQTMTANGMSDFRIPLKPDQRKHLLELIGGAQLFRFKSQSLRGKHEATLGDTRAESNDP